MPPAGCRGRKTRWVRDDSSAKQEEADSRHGPKEGAGQSPPADKLIEAEAGQQGKEQRHQKDELGIAPEFIEPRHPSIEQPEEGRMRSECQQEEQPDHYQRETARPRITPERPHDHQDAAGEANEQRHLPEVAPAPVGHGFDVAEQVGGQQRQEVLGRE